MTYSRLARQGAPLAVCLSFVFWGLLGARCGDAQDAPRIVSVLPEVGSDGVDPNLNEIRLTFNHDMEMTEDPWPETAPNFPKVVGKPRWIDNRNCVLPVKLEPGKSYYMSFNSLSFKNLQTVDDRRLEFEIFWFRTALAGGQAVSPAAPKIATTDPENGAENVDPALTEIRVTFDREMDTGGYSWIGGGETYPEVTDEARWADERTCVLPVHLKPGQAYQIGINSATSQHFRSKGGVAVTPTTLWFRTEAGEEKPQPTRPPRIATIWPPIGAKNVDFQLAELRVTFDQDMNQRGYSWTGGGPTFPKTTGKARWINRRTCVLPVKLEPDKKYYVGINSYSYRNFRNIAGMPLRPVLLRFETAKIIADGSSTPSLTPAEQRRLNEQSFEALRKALRERYAYYDLREIDWDARFEAHKERILGARTNLEWATWVADLLSAAQDLHLSIRCDGEHLGTHSRMVDPNWRWENVAAAIKNVERRNPAVATGRTDDGIVYILIQSWARLKGNPLRAVHGILEESKHAKGIILDVRPNAGGDELLAREVAQWFFEKPAVYSRNVYRDPSTPTGWTKVFDRAVQPNPPANRYTSPVAVLMGPYNMSSCESFLLMMRQAPHATLLGARTFGSSGNPKPHKLPNGAEIYLPSWKDLRPDGSCFEGEGISPDLFVYFPTDGSYAGDPVLERALDLLRQPAQP